MSTSLTKKRKGVAKVVEAVSPPRSENRPPSEQARGEGSVEFTHNGLETPEQQLQRRVRTLEATVWSLEDRLQKLMASITAPTLPLEIGITAEPEPICSLQFASRDRFYSYFRVRESTKFVGQIAIANEMADKLGVRLSGIELLAVEKKGR